MFGYVVVNKQEMKFREFDLYRSYYCGLCRELKASYGTWGQLTLSYDITFLALLLTSLYGEETDAGTCRCGVHPFRRQMVRRNMFTAYGADMNLLLTYYKCQDDWEDERKLSKKALGALLKGKAEDVKGRYPSKAQVIQDCLAGILDCEKRGSQNLDEASGFFGDIMGEVFVFQQDEWEGELRRMGFFLGKFVYLMDAYEDMEKDTKEGNYNPFGAWYQRPQFEEECRSVLTMMMAECSRSFERLPLIEYTEILRNILYSGVWHRYEQVQKKRREKEEKGTEHV